MVFVNNELLYSFTAYGIVTLVQYLVYSDMFGKMIKRFFKLCAFIVWLIFLCAAGVYVSNNYNQTGGDEYNRARNMTVYCLWAISLAGLLAVEYYKHRAKDDSGLSYVTVIVSKDGGNEHDEMVEMDECPGYEDTGILLDVFTNSRVHRKGQSIAATVFAGIMLVQVFIRFLFIVQVNIVSSTGMSPVVQWWGHITGWVGLSICVVSIVQSMMYKRAISYNPQTKTEDYHKIGKDGWFTLHPALNVLYVKFNPYMIMMYVCVDLVFSLVFFNDYSSQGFYMSVVILYSIMNMSVTKTFASWFFFYMYAWNMYGFIYFMYPVYALMHFNNAADSDAWNDFIPSGVNRHIMLPMEYNHTTQMFRSSWTSDYQLTSLAQGVSSLFVAIFSAAIGFYIIIACNGYGLPSKVPRLADMLVYSPSDMLERYVETGTFGTLEIVPVV